MSEIQLDHIIWAGPDLDRATMEIRDLTGVRPIRGGSHPGLGTANALLALGEGAYLEILAPDPTQSSRGRLGQRLQDLHAGGLFHWAVRTNDLSETCRRLDELGLEHSGIVDGHRKTPDGSSITWKTVFVDSGMYGACVPFFIDWCGSKTPAAASNDVQLQSFRIVSENSKAYREVADCLEIEVDVETGSPTSLSAELATPLGAIRLSSFASIGNGISWGVDQ